LTRAFELGAPPASLETLPNSYVRDHPDNLDNRTTRHESASTGSTAVQEAGRTDPGPPPALALEPDVLGLLVADIRRAGVAGEERIAQIVYLAGTSRLLPWGRPGERPVSVIAKGATSTGKSHATRTTLKFFPGDAFIDLGSMSPKYLFYAEESFAHKILYIPEWATIKNDPEIVAMVRVLLSEGRIVHGTVEGEGRKRGRKIVKDGPTGVILTTTEPVTEPELETRCLSVSTDDSREQTRRVYEAIAQLEDAEAAVDFQRWHELQAWLASFGETSVVIPYVTALAVTMPDDSTRLRRDFVTELSLVRAHAILHRAQREIDTRGRIVATIADYAAVRELVGEIIAQGVDAAVSTAVRDTVEAVSALEGMPKVAVTPSAVIARLEVGRSAGYDRIRRALASGYLINEAPAGHRGMKLVTGAALPGDSSYLPEPEDILRHMSGNATGHQSPAPSRPGVDPSGCPERPADTDDAAAEESSDPLPRIDSEKERAETNPDFAARSASRWWDCPCGAVQALREPSCSFCGCLYREEYRCDYTEGSTKPSRARQPTEDVQVALLADGADASPKGLETL
jgi:hypothetical protein